MLPVMAAANLITRLATAGIPASGTRWCAVLSASGIGLIAIATYCILLMVTRALPFSVFRGVGLTCRGIAHPRTKGWYDF